MKGVVVPRRMINKTKNNVQQTQQKNVKKYSEDA
jgi:hypothetical protein